MHISLDSALGRQRRLNSVGESVFQIAPDAAAGYSLRSLTGGDPAVVRVRRESDNNERDFRSSEINSGGMVRWVNEQITPPLDLRELTATGRDGPIIEAAAAYSLRNLSDSYTGSVVEVRRSSDGNTQSFTAAEVADGTLEAWVLGDAASLVGDAQYFNGTDAEVILSTGITFTGDFDISLQFIGVDQSLGGHFFADTAVEELSRGFFTDSDIRLVTSTDPALTATVTFDRGAHTVRFRRSSGTAYIDLDGVNLTSAASTGSLIITGIGSVRGAGSATPTFNGVMLGVDFGTASYTGLGATPWVDTIGSNDGTPSNLVTFTGQGFDGTVSKWYDQSTTSGVPNANHAVQTDAASQPKIVDGGSLITRGTLNEPSISFGTFTDKHFDVAGRPTTKSVFSTLQAGDTNFENLVTDTNNNSPRITTNNAANNRVYSFVGFDTPSVNINGSTYNGTSAAGSFNFHLLSMTSATGDSIDRIGANAATGVTANSFDFVSELILYPDDQTDNRTALEANIGEVYGIAGIPAYEDTVNGFVETWYDQSGNGNDASQLTAGSQPKIVDAGALVTGGIDFDGTDDQLDFTGLAAADLAIFSVARFDVVASQQRILGADSGNSDGFGLANATTGFFRANGGTATQPALNVTLTNTADFLYSGTRSSNSLTFFTNGTASAVATNSDTFNADSIGGGTLPINGKLQEVIIYNTDQSANRLAIEANINNQYDIY